MLHFLFLKTQFILSPSLWTLCEHSHHSFLLSTSFHLFFIFSSFYIFFPPVSLLKRQQFFVSYKLLSSENERIFFAREWSPPPSFPACKCSSIQEKKEKERKKKNSKKKSSALLPRCYVCSLGAR
eukprot:TRINITY_DN3746_c2_g1_i1.p1 TRINITY_DN3746_c2_g1~~TRINITY_DN3746_c2_g1_i1.p1  ORF type:complete len:125 (+),score=7.51 TRINITY_DN3746_c2_g1_i1:1401-1775(+)